MNNKNETLLYKPFANKSKTKKNDKVRNNENSNLFMSKTFASKLFLKLTAKIIDPIIVCLQTLKFEPENRKREEIENTIPYLKTLDNFSDYIHFRENPKNSFELMVKFAKIAFYQYYRKNTILKRPGSSNDKFYILLSGTIDKYSLIFEKENLTLEQYLLYLVKMTMINEDEIIKKCHILNKSTLNIGADEISISNFFKTNKKINYLDIQSKAEKELSKLGFNNNLYQDGVLRRVPSIENYLKIFNCITPKISENDGKPKFKISIGKYKLISILIKGQFFNNISEEIIKEYNMYICKSNCDIGQISRKEFCNNKLNIAVQLKMENVFKEIKNEFYFLRGINNDKFIHDYSHLMLYKKYKKGDKIFLQGGLYEGIYLVYDGEIALTTKTNIDKLGQLLINVIYSIKGFPEHIPAFDSKKLIEEFNNKHQLLYSKGDIPFLQFLAMKNIDISKVKKNDILGLNELYDYKTELFNFTAECISDEATLFFITKNDFGLMLGREPNLYSAILSIVEYKIQFIAGKLRSFSEQTLQIFEKNHKKSKTNSTSNIYDIYDNISINKNNNSKFNISKFNNSIFNSSKINNSSSYSYKSNLSNRNCSLKPLSQNNYIKEKKDNINKMSLNKINNESLYNNDYVPLSHKTLKTKRTNSNYKNEYMKYSSLNDKLWKKKFISNEYNTNYEKKILNIFNSTQPKILNNNRLLNDFKGYNTNIFSNLNNNFLSIPNSSIYNEILFYPSLKNKNFEKIRLFPILKNRFLNNNKLKNKKIKYS